MPDGPPMYQQIAEELHRTIAAGALKPGDKLPAERDLMKEHGVSRTTIRQALALLSADGLTESRRGAGVYVRQYRPIRRIANDRLAPDRWRTGRPVWQADAGEQRAASSTAQRVPAPEGIASALAVPAGTPVILQTVQQRSNGRPVQRARSYVPADLVEGTPLADLDADEDTYVHLAAAGHTPVRTREEARSRMPTPIERSALGLSQGTPVLLLAVTAYDADDRPVDVTEILLDASTYVLEYNITP